MRATHDVLKEILETIQSDVPMPDTMPEGG